MPTTEDCTRFSGVYANNATTATTLTKEAMLTETLHYIHIPENSIYEEELSEETQVSDQQSVDLLEIYSEEI